MGDGHQIELSGRGRRADSFGDILGADGHVELPGDDDREKSFEHGKR